MFGVINISEGGFLVIVKENASMILFNIGSADGLLLLFIYINNKDNHWKFIMNGNPLYIKNNF